jgi:tripartite ATP-independent transporter DctM subunit
MATAGLWMLLVAAVLMVATGLPAWILLIAVAMVAAGIGVAAGVMPAALFTALPARLLSLLDSDLLQALPLYVFMGALLNRLPLAQALFCVARRVLARTGAGAPLAGLALGGLLAPMNGSVGAGVSMFSHLLHPRLAQAGVPAAQSAALVAVASTLGVVIPPSLVLILLADAMMRAHTEALNTTHSAVRIINEQDIFRGALSPALIVALLCAGVAWWMNRSRGAAELPEAPRASDWIAAPATLLLISGLLGGVTLGYLYAVEAAAAGGVALVLYSVGARLLTLARLRAILRDTLAVTGALFALLIGATVFTLVLRAFETDRWVANAIGALGGGPFAVLVAVLGAIALCAFVLDAFEMIFVVIPVVMPPLLIQVPDATWVAVLTMLILQTSFLLPPFGYAVMMVRNRLAHAGHALELAAYARACLPYLLAQLAVLALVLVFPRVSGPGPEPIASAPANQPAPSDADLSEMLRRQLEAPAADGGGQE